MIDALGIINFEGNTVDIQGIQDYRPVAAASFLGRYRLVDFMLSNMTNSGISDIQVYVKEKPRTMIEHLKDGKQYNINSKRGNLSIMHGEARVISEVYNTDVANFMQNLQFIEDSSKSYVVVAPSYMIYTVDFETVLNSHKTNGNDITVLYHNTDTAKEQFLACDTLIMNKEKRITGMEPNRGKYKSRTISMEAYVMKKALFTDLVQRAANTSSLYWFRDILKDVLDEYNVVGYPVRGFVACINTLPAYLKTSMELTNFEVAEKLLRPEWPIHTLTNDSAPTLYNGASVRRSLIANGCTIEGTVENCVIGRNVTVKKGAVLKNCVVLSGAYISGGAVLTNCVVDKYSIVHHKKELVGTENDPVYVKRRDRV